MKQVAFALLAVLALAGCGKKEDVIVAAADRVTITAADIDRDPVALLPSAAVGILKLDAHALYQSAVGQRLDSMTKARMPLPPSAGYEPTRDLDTLYLGLYSMSGADVAAVAVGRFDPQAIDQAANGTTMTPLGAPLVRTTYAKQTLYVSRNVGFAVLTPHTALFGDETGIRRALDRLSEGRASHDVPKWVDDVLGTPNAAMVGAFNFVGQAPVEGVMKNLAFLRGLQTARVVGNFQPPGMNFAGTLSYPDGQTAQTAAANIQAMNQQLQSYSFFMRLAGIGNPIQRLDVLPQGNDAQFVVAVEQKAIEWLLTQAADRMGVAGTTVPASTAPMGAPAR
ncbi:MAG TPA: hypothetical protein VHE30_17915 [Polyangiaceae bacterium]|nr:hypothetical protein [Polyangiaceae bacterium]